MTTQHIQVASVCEGCWNRRSDNTYSTDALLPHNHEVVANILPKHCSYSSHSSRVLGRNSYQEALHVSEHFQAPMSLVSPFDWAVFPPSEQGIWSPGHSRFQWSTTPVAMSLKPVSVYHSLLSILLESPWRAGMWLCAHRGRQVSPRR